MNVIWEGNKLKTLIAVLAVLIAVIVAYYPGLHGPFVFDDQTHIVSDPSIRITSLSGGNLVHAVLTEDGSLSNRPLAKISLAINYYLWGGVSSTLGYKTTNLAIHLVNAWLVYLLALMLLKWKTRAPCDVKRVTPEWTAILVAALWALHPLHLTSVLYVVQRMTSMAALFVLAGLIIYIHGRQRVREQRHYGYGLMVAGAIGGLVLGLGCKENAVVILPLMLVIETVFFGSADDTAANRRKLRWFYASFVYIPAALLVLWLMTHPNFILDPYISRNFTLVERLLTESRVLWYYVSLLFIPDVGRLALFHDDIPISHGLFEPWTTPLALFAVVAAIIVAFLARRRHSLFSFAVLWYLVGHSIESSLIGLEIAHEHRNYLPDVGLLLALGYGLGAAAQRFQGPVRVTLLFAPLATLAFVTNTLAHTWASDEGIIESLARHHPESARGQYMLAEVYAERKHDLIDALMHYRRATELAPNETGYLMKSVLTTTVIQSGLDEYVGNPPKNSNGYNGNFERQAAADDRRETSLQTGIAALPVTTTTSKIGARLKEQPITPTTLHILDDLAKCVDQVSNSCRVVYPHIKNWYLAAAQNPHLSNEQRTDLVIHLFDLGASRPDLDLSMQAAALGKKIEPTSPVYLLMEANVHILRGELDTADAMLRSVSQDPNAILTDELQDNIKTLFGQIAARKAGPHPHQTGYK